MGDFYGAWLACRIESIKIDTPLASLLAAAMKQREKLLLGNDTFCAALFLDPDCYVPNERRMLQNAAPLLFIIYFMRFI